MLFRSSCWTRNNRAEPFWRLYASRCEHIDGHGTPLPPSRLPVRISMTIASLMAVLEELTNVHQAKAFIGEVGYCEADKLKGHAPDLRGAHKLEKAKVAASALHLKRVAFKFEKEVRALWIEHGTRKDFWMIPFDPLRRIAGVMVGPTRFPSEAKAPRREIRALGFAYRRVRRSLMYAKPKN